MKKYPDIDSLEAHIKSDLLWNSVSITRELADADKQWKAKKWLEYGQDMGLVIDKVIIGTNKFKLAETAPQFSLKDAEQIVMGILEGAVKAEGLDNINNCIKDAETIYTDVKDGVVLLKKGDAADELNGLKDIAAGVFKIKDAVTDCEGVVADFEKLGEMAAIFSNPWSFAYHVGKDLILNGVDIFHEVEDSVTQFESSNYEAFGVDVGEALAKLILGNPNMIQEYQEFEQKQKEGLNLF